jgi:hypothetical protein
MYLSVFNSSHQNGGKVDVEKPAHAINVRLAVTRDGCIDACHPS